MTKKLPDMQGPACPVPLQHKKKIVLGHGSGGQMSQDLITNMFLPPFDNPYLRANDDAGVVGVILDNGFGEEISGRLAISTDSHVVWPLFFAGGDIGRLAVCGTVNDVAMMGATPNYLTAGFILEEGLSFDVLEKIVGSMHDAALEANIKIIAGDTKVVQKGKADWLYINTTGIGIVPPGLEISGANTQPGDIVILSGSIGDHGIVVLEARQELGFTSGIKSDIAPLNHLVNAILNVSNQVHTMRDPTRGGLATSLNEIARQSKVCIFLDENSIPIKPGVAAVCEILGFDPLFIANEGKLIVIVGRDDADKVIETMHAERYGEEAVIIGEVKPEPQSCVLMRTPIGSTRVVGILSGEMLPRIC